VVDELGEPRLLHSGFRLSLRLAPGAKGPARLCLWTDDPILGRRAAHVVDPAMDACPN
jgi:hypothetical protein